MYTGIEFIILLLRLGLDMNYFNSGNHERDVPGTGSFYDTNDSGGECGVLAETMFYVPSENRAKFWYIVFLSLMS